MIFPVIQPRLYEPDNKLPMCKEIAWNYKENIPIWREGNPVMVEGAEAVAVWAYNALQTERFRYDIYSWNYGCELDSLIGNGYAEELQQSEAARLVRECLLINQYIREVSDIKVVFENSNMSIACKLLTIYGEVKLNV